MSETYKTPGQLIEALLEERGWDRQVLAVLLGIGRPGVSKLLSGAKKVDAGVALALAEVFGIAPERLLQLQQTYDLATARFVARPDETRANRAVLFSQLPISEMIHRGWLQAESVRDIGKVESGLAKLFGVSSVAEIPLLPHAHAAKKTDADASATTAQLAWIYRVKQLARGLVVSPYTHETGLNAVKKLSGLLFSAEEGRKVPRILAESGIRFVIVESLKSTKMDGVCCWLNDSSPVIGMSIRFDRIDNFWFVLRHEVEHVLRGHGRDVLFFDAELEGERAGTGQSVSEEERIANTAAQDFCAPSASIDNFIARKAPIFAERDLLGFARILQVHPGIVTGQIHRKTNRYDIFRKHLVKMRSIVSAGAVVDGWGDVAPVYE